MWGHINCIYDYGNTVTSVFPYTEIAFPTTEIKMCDPYFLNYSNNLFFVIRNLYLYLH